jgi:O-antigen/teichoic acid export membrane protein
MHRMRFRSKLGLNLAGQITPLLAAIVSLPPLIAGLGEERFGVLGLAWVMVGYFSLFDLGIGRALTVLVASRTAAGEHRDLPELVWTALLLMGILGTTGGALVALISPWMVASLLRIPTPLQSEVQSAFLVLAPAIPCVTLTASFRGLLEAAERFDLTNAVRIPLGLLHFVAPWGAVYLCGRDLSAAVTALTLCRAVGLAAYVFLAWRFVPALASGPVFRRRSVRPLLQLGTWTAASNIISPLMVSLDRFLVATLVGIGAVAYYVTPYEMVTKLLLVPTAVVGVVFPAFSRLMVQSPSELGQLFSRTVRGLFILIGLPVLALVTLAPDLLRWYLNEDFAASGGVVMRWLLAGVWINSIAFIPAALLQAAKRPDLSTKLHLLELPVYLLMVWGLARQYGVAGVAAAWALRIILDAGLLLVLAHRFLPRPPVDSRGLWGVLGALCLLLMVPFATSTAARLILAAAQVATFSVLAWRAILTHEERQDLLRLLRWPRPATGWRPL